MTLDKDGHVKDKNFRKAWPEFMGDAYKTRIDSIVFWWIFENITSDNMFYGPQERIAKESGMTKRTLNAAFAKLEEVDFIRKCGHGGYMVNPNAYSAPFNAKKRLKLLDKYYNKLKKKGTTNKNKEETKNAKKNKD